jgi:hypothetical protein
VVFTSVVTPFSLLAVHHHFRGACCFLLRQCVLEEAGSSETIRRHILDHFRCSVSFVRVCEFVLCVSVSVCVCVRVCVVCKCECARAREFVLC